MKKNGYVDVLHKMVYIYFIKQMYKFKICLVNKRCSFVFGKVEYGNKNCLWFSFTKLVMYLVHRVFLSLRYAYRCFMGTCILYFLCMGFHEHFIRAYFYWGENFSLRFSRFDFDVRYFASR